jgi:hypothetical protein
MWPGYSSPPMPRDNGLRRCCGLEPSLRVRDGLVWYECRKGGETGKAVPMTDDRHDDEVAARMEWQTKGE